MTDWLTGWHSDLLIDWLIGWLTYWLGADLLTDLLTSLLTKLTDQYYWLTDWFNYWLTVWLIDGLTDWLAHYWLEWLTEVLRFMLRKGINFNAFMMWTKINAIADPDESDWHFISDQICPTDVSGCQQRGFWAYLQYCKWFIGCFVIPLLSEPDKLNLCSLFKVKLVYSFISF